MVAIDLSGRTALVTGGSQGLGADTVRALHEAGANVVINYFDEVGNRARAEGVAGELGARALAVPADVRNYEQVRAMIDQARRHFGRIDMLVNNAGILRDRTLAKMSLGEWQDVIETNLTGVFHVCHAAVPVLESGGCVVNISSLSAAIGTFGQANYAAAKAGIIGLTRTMSRELGKRGIRVNAVAPGLVLTEMGKTVPQEVRDQWIGQVSLGRFGQPRDISSVILFLCSPLAAYVTGQTIHVNGGWFLS